MAYLTLVIALGIVFLFSYWSVNRRLQLQKRQKPKVTKAAPLSKVKRQTNLRRVK